MTESAQIICGIGIGDGAALGRLHWIEADLPQHEAGAAGTPEDEAARFRAAQRRASEALEALYTESCATVGEEAAQIFSTHAMIAVDEDFTDLVLARIAAGDSAETAVVGAAETLAAQFRGMEDEYLRARAGDFGDIAARLCDILTDGGRAPVPTIPDWPEPIILAARDLSPSRTVGLDRSRVVGFVTVGGSSGSHTAILARSLGLPALVGTGELAAAEGCRVLLDAAAGQLILEPDPTALAAYHAREEARAATDRARLGLRDRPAATRTGRQILLCANIGHPREAAEAMAVGADGVGLFRSEFLYLDRAAPPNESEQYAAYREAAEALGERMLVIRTLDIGADKRVGYLELAAEENPALGLRGIRLCLAQRALFDAQLRAICRVAGERPGQLAVMFPMVSALQELDAAQAALEEAQAAVSAEGRPIDPALAVGIMIETPAAAVLAPLFADRCAFFSIGSNDLIQYTLAADRQNAAVADLAVPDHPAVLALIERAATAIHATGGWCGLCGEMAADPAMTETLLRLGIDELSVSPANLLKIKEAILACE